jgi:hypothetical protein
MIIRRILPGPRADAPVRELKIPKKACHLDQLCLGKNMESETRKR